MQVEGSEDKPFVRGTAFLIPVDPSDGGIQLIQFQPQNGYYNFDSVAPGRYKIWSSGAIDYYLKSLQSGDLDLNPESIQVGEGATLTLLMTFKKSESRLAGDVELSQDQAGKPVHVLVISEESKELSDLKCRRPQLDQSFRFSLAHLRPGKYLAFAAQDAISDLCDDHDFFELIRSKGVEVDIHDREQQSVHLKLIAKEETDDIQRRLAR